MMCEELKNMQGRVIIFVRSGLKILKLASVKIQKMYNFIYPDCL